MLGGSLIVKHFGPLKSAEMGFIPMCDGEYFTNGEIDIFDALPNNVLHGIDGNLFFIDTICLPSDDNYLDTYKSRSPNWK
ncbi:MAG: hypothetical protein K2K95_06855 [Muribaculaceae bacterium]|nr:hypothetical protein [Muribaculaceae bacterium]